MVANVKGNVVAVTLLSILVVVAVAAFVVSEVQTIPPTAGLAKIKAETSASLGRVIDFALNEHSKGGFSIDSDVWYCKQPRPPRVDEMKLSLEDKLLTRSNTVLEELAAQRAYNYTGEISFDYGLDGIDTEEDLIPENIDFNGVQVKVDGFTFGVDNEEISAEQAFQSQYAYPYKMWLMYKTFYQWMENDLGDGVSDETRFSRLVELLFEGKPCQKRLCSCHPPRNLLSESELLGSLLTKAQVEATVDQSVQHLNALFEGTDINCTVSLSEDFLVENMQQMMYKAGSECYYGCDLDVLPSVGIWNDAPVGQSPACNVREAFDGFEPIGGAWLNGVDSSIIDAGGSGERYTILVGLEQRFAGFVNIECKDSTVFVEGETGIAPYTAKIKLSVAALKNCNIPNECPETFPRASDMEECPDGPSPGPDGGQGGSGVGSCCEEGESIEDCRIRLLNEVIPCGICGVCRVTDDDLIVCTEGMKDKAALCNDKFEVGKWDDSCVQLVCDEATGTWSGCEVIPEFNEIPCKIKGTTIMGNCWTCNEEGMCDPEIYSDGKNCFNTSLGGNSDFLCNACSSGSCSSVGYTNYCRSHNGCRTYCSTASGYSKCNDTRDVGMSCNVRGNNPLWECNECTIVGSTLNCVGQCSDGCCASSDMLFGQCKPSADSGCCVTKISENNYVIHKNAGGDWIDCGQTA